jgi:hypothetical protein
MLPAQPVSRGVSLPAPVWIAPGTLLVLALMDLPYGYYQFLRIATCAAAVFICWRLFEAARSVGAWVMVAIALLYNPIVPVHLEHSTWAIINMATAAAFVAIGLLMRQSPKK